MHQLDEKDRIDRRHIMALLNEIQTRKHLIETTIRDEISRASSDKRSGAERYWLMMLEWIGEKFPEPNNAESFTELDEMEDKVRY
jgi:hypothetical protein